MKIMSTGMYPRIIREFDDGPDEKPMIYWSNHHES